MYWGDGSERVWCCDRWSLNGRVAMPSVVATSLPLYISRQRTHAWAQDENGWTS